MSYFLRFFAHKIQLFYLKIAHFEDIPLGVIAYNYFNDTNALENMELQLLSNFSAIFEDI